MTKLSRWIVVLIWAGLILYLTTIPDFHPSTNSWVSMFLSTGGHFFFFGVLALLIPLTTRPSLLATILYGLSIELAQRTIPGRSFSLLDLGLDALGAIVFLRVMRKYTQ